MASAQAIQASCQPAAVRKWVLFQAISALTVQLGQMQPAPKICDSLNSCATHKDWAAISGANSLQAELGGRWSHFSLPIGRETPKKRDFPALSVNPLDGMSIASIFISQ
jgi:hypothetical protein